VFELLKRVLQMLFQQKAGVIGADSDAHDARLYYGFMVQGSRFTVQGSRFTVHGSGFKVQGAWHVP
jgi:hypothetical protein